MANPRRASSFPQPISTPALNPSPLPSSVPLLSSVTLFLRRPHAFPFLLSVFVLLTWISLRFQNHRRPSFLPPSPLRAEIADADAHLVRFGALDFPSRISRDKRGWLLNPVAAAKEAEISGGAESCVSVHVGEIRPGGIRGNHRHHSCNETFVIWGAETKFRVENPLLEKGYAEVVIGADEVAIAASPSGTAHVLVNVDSSRTSFFWAARTVLLITPTQKPTSMFGKIFDMFSAFCCSS